MNLIEQIEKLLVNDYGRVYELRKDLRAIIEQAKREAAEPVAWCIDDGHIKKFWAVKPSDDDFMLAKRFNWLAYPVYTSPQPDHTKLIGELVKALEIADELIGVEPCERVAQETADGQRTIRALLTKAREMNK